MGETTRLPEPLERPGETFSGRAVDVLREMVLLGQLPPGQRLNEVELANALGISRGPLREAIQRLRSEGLLTAVSGRGAYVRTFTADELRDLYEVRIALETHAVRLAGQKIGTGAASDLGTLVDAADPETTEYSHSLDLDFHRKLAALAENEALVHAITEIHQQVQLALSRPSQLAGRAEQSHDRHREILDHLAEGRAEKAAAVLSEHLRHSLDKGIEVLQADHDH